MKFGEEETDTLYKKFLKQAVKDTGLNLVRIDEVAKAGLIDNNMRAVWVLAESSLTDYCHRLHRIGSY